MIVYQIYNGMSHVCNDIFEEYQKLNNIELVKKIEHGVTLFHEPWKECVPYFENNRFVFINMNALEYFLYDLCKLTQDDITYLENEGFNVLRVEVDCYVTGLSKTIATIDEDEVFDSTIVLWSKVNDDYYVPTMNTIEKKLQRESFNQYYNEKDMGRYSNFIFNEKK